MDPRGGEPLLDTETNHFRSSNYPDDEKSRLLTLTMALVLVQFLEHFGKYGEIMDSVITKDRKTGQPRGFGFVTYAEPSVVDKVIEDTHVINGKQVEIKRIIPKEASGSKDFKTRKIFVGGTPSTDYFTRYGEFREHEIMRDHATNRSRGFGFITFETEQAVDDLLEKGNKIDFAGAQLEIKRTEPKKPNPPPHLLSDIMILGLHMVASLEMAMVDIEVVDLVVVVTIYQVVFMGDELVVMVTYNKKGVLIGVEATKLASFEGMVARSMMNFELDPRSRKNTLQSIGTKWNNFKHHLYKKFIEKLKNDPNANLLNPPDMYPYLKKDDWKVFVSQRLSKKWEMQETGKEEDEIDRALLWKKPNSISDNAEVVTLIGSCKDAANQINQKEIHWGLLEDSLEERLEKAGGLRSDSEKTEEENKERDVDEINVPFAVKGPVTIHYIPSAFE
ncbi:amine oxidase family protein [Hibiscus syriacus]|uniref:Amine oxidase family protein n=1 Tax=Hibiscus syriacus TaxID=106335 RepID=A0A6A2YPY7_HIBSY|nr:amine oxidase family protein [Hibiscus syriacus]